MPGDWLSGYDNDDDAYDDAYIPEKPQPEISPVKILVCTHCGSDRLRPRSSDRESETIRFNCVKCNRTSSHKCPMGYSKVYKIN